MSSCDRMPTLKKLFIPISFTSSRIFSKPFTFFNERLGKPPGATTKSLKIIEDRDEINSFRTKKLITFSFILKIEASFSRIHSTQILNEGCSVSFE